MASASAFRRSHGTGSLLALRATPAGASTGTASGARTAARSSASSGRSAPRARADGLTRAQAERELRRVMDEVTADPVVEELSLEEAGRRHVDRLELLGRKRSTLMDYRSTLRVHLVPFFGDAPIAAITAGQIERYLTVKLARRAARPRASATTSGCCTASSGSRRSAAGSRAIRASTSSCRARARTTTATSATSAPRRSRRCCRAVPDDDLGCTERLLYRAAAMTGLRQGELLALRWRDVDWPAGRVRVRRSLVRGEFGTPKSRRASRSVPLADALAAALDAHQRALRLPGR